MPKVNKVYRHITPDPIGDLMLRAIKQRKKSFDELALDCGYSDDSGIRKSFQHNLSEQMKRIKHLANALEIPEDQLLEAVGQYVYGRKHYDSN